eukprot:1658577-Pyramimonas_sp.AAC.1
MAAPPTYLWHLPLEVGAAGVQRGGGEHGGGHAAVHLQRTLFLLPHQVAVDEVEVHRLREKNAAKGLGAVDKHVVRVLQLAVE